MSENKEKMIPVRAIRRGYLGRRPGITTSPVEPGAEFEVKEKEFSKNWMERLDQPKRGRKKGPGMSVETPADKKPQEATESAASTGDTEVI